jgi:hypothetical protein
MRANTCQCADCVFSLLLGCRDSCSIRGNSRVTWASRHNLLLLSDVPYNMYQYRVKCIECKFGQVCPRARPLYHLTDCNSCTRPLYEVLYNPAHSSYRKGQSYLRQQPILTIPLSIRRQLQKRSAPVFPFWCPILGGELVVFVLAHAA